MTDPTPPASGRPWTRWAGRYLIAVAVLLAAGVAVIQWGYTPGTPPLFAEMPEEAREALEREGPRAMHRTLRALAEQGDFGATQTLAMVYRRGYLQTSADGTRRHHPVFVWPGQADQWQQRYETMRDHLAAEGDPAALFAVAGALERATYRDGEWVQPTEAARDSALAIRERLSAENNPQAWMALGLRLRHSDPARSDSLLALAEAADVNGACFWRTLPEPGAWYTAAGINAYADEAADCADPTDPESDVLGRIVRDLRAEHERGNPASVVVLDSLRALGLFERHPRLAAV